MLLYNYTPVSRSLRLEIDRLQREMNRLFETPAAAVGSEFPSVNVWVSENDAVVTAEVPGMEPGDIDISARGEMLSLRGSRNVETHNGDQPFQRRERFAGAFTRTIQLPFPVEVDKIEATCKYGILQVTLPRAELDKPTKITVM